jgi:hypothetical protein
MKGVEGCDKLGEAVKQALIPIRVGGSRSPPVSLEVSPSLVCKDGSRGFGYRQAGGYLLRLSTKDTGRWVRKGKPAYHVDHGQVPRRKEISALSLFQIAWDSSGILRDTTQLATDLFREGWKGCGWASQEV